MSYLYNPNPTPIFNNSGQFASGALAYFYAGATTTPLVVYQDSELTAPHPIPVVADIVGKFPAIFIPYGSYSVRITDADGATLYYPNGSIDNPAPPSAGGGITVAQNQIYNTGDIKFNFSIGTQDGFVRMNGLTLGSLASGATEYAADNAANLFAYIYARVPDSIAPVSSGRGASAIADFAANKTIVIPTMEGFLAAGVGNMGNAAGALQATTTCTPTGASNVVPVASATNIAVGQYVIINGVSAGTVTAISGTNITLSVTPAAGSSVSWRSSFFSDAQQVGASGGVQNVTMTSDQMPSHTHTVTDPGHHHGMNFLNAYANGIAGATNGGGSAGQTGDSTTGITLGNTGGGHPFGIIQPSRLFTFYMKL